MNQCLEKQGLLVTSTLVALYYLLNPCMTLTKSWHLTRIYTRGIGDALSAHCSPNIPPQSNHKIMQDSRKSLTQVNLNQASLATHIYTTLPKQSTKPTTPITPKTKRYRSWASDMDRYDSNTADGDVSK